MLLPRPLPLLCVASTAATLLLQDSYAFLLPPASLHVSSTRAQPSHKRPLGASFSSHHPTTVPLPGPPAEWTEGLPPDKHALFLREFWQQKPLLIRQAFDPAVAVVGPSELLALACDDMVTSRLIEYRPRSEVDKQKKADEDEDDEDIESEWTVRQGPFDEDEFEEGEEGEERRWTVLVQEVDRHVPEVADLLQSFRFLPNWRVDDIMISYAPQAGGIGPHVDNYDVFLLQGHGTRRWSIQNSLLSPADELASLLPNSPVRTLGTWEESHSWVLQPGDMLYLPPRVPHNGVSLDKDCMTYSIGFRAPTQVELLQAATTTAAAAATAAAPRQIFYTDPSLALPRDAGEITLNALSQLKEMVKAGLASVLEDEYAYAKWMGKHLTKPKRSRRRMVENKEDEEEEEEDEEEGAGGYSVEMDREEAEAILQELMEGGREGGEDGSGAVYRAEGLKFAHAFEGRLLFVDGHVWELKDEDEGRRRRVCACLTGGPSPLPAGEIKELLQLSPECGEIVREWLERGFLYVLGEEIEVEEEEGEDVKE